VCQRTLRRRLDIRLAVVEQIRRLQIRIYKEVVLPLVSFGRQPVRCDGMRARPFSLARVLAKHNDWTDARPLQKVCEQEMSNAAARVRKLEYAARRVRARAIAPSGDRVVEKCIESQ